MTVYDAGMVSLVIGGMIWGAWRGITWQLASIASLVVGYLVAHPLSFQIADQFPGDPLVARGLAMLVVYAATSGGIFFVAWLLRATLRRLQFEAYDRHLGMVLGGLEGSLVGILVTLFIVSLAPSSRQPIFESPSGKVMGTVMQTVGPIMPNEARTILKPFWDGGTEDTSDAERSIKSLKTIADALPTLSGDPKRTSDKNAGIGTTERR